MIFISRLSQENKFYVYQYVRKNNSKNGLTGTPYYIGKGTQHRAFRKHSCINIPTETERIQIISKNMNEADAFQLEMLLIHLHGRIDRKTGYLRNRTDGGEGVVGSDHTGSKNPMFNKKHSAKVCEDSRQRRSQTNSIRRWYNNSTETKFLTSCPIGWKLGRINQKPTTAGGKWYNNGKIAVVSQEKPVGDNWIAGMLSH